MFRRFILTLLTPVLAFVLASTSSAPAFAGGPPSFSFDAPSRSGTPSASGPVMIVHAYSCHAPTDAAVTARAEGLVNGERRTIPLELKGTGQTGVYEVTRQWPAEGSWVLTFSVDRGGQTTALVSLDSGGQPIFEASPKENARTLSAGSLRTVSGKASAHDIQAMLANRIGKLGERAGK